MGMSTGGGKKGKINSDINVTPLVDVVLVLLIIFMVVTPMLQKGRAVQLPEASNPDALPEDESEILISVSYNLGDKPSVWLETKEVNLPDLEALLVETYQRNPGKRVVLKGDKRLSYGDVKDVMVIVNRAGFTGLGIIAERKGVPGL